MKIFRKAFTLMEVNLAIVVMATGILGLIALYALGFRENAQSIEDVEGTACADRNLSALVAALSSTNVTWQQWMKIDQLPQGGWNAYFQNASVRNAELRLVTNPSGVAQQAFDGVMSAVGGGGKFDNCNLMCGLVAIREGAKITLAMRCSTRAGTLAYQPLYYTEVFFQGLDREGAAQ